MLKDPFLAKISAVLFTTSSTDNPNLNQQSLHIHLALFGSKEFNC